MPKPDSSTNNVLIIGGLLVDDIAISSENLTVASSNPVSWQQRLGGVATNVARVAAQQLNVLLIASTGDDSQGTVLANLLAQEALSSSLVIWPKQTSDRYTAVLNPDGELFIGLADAQLAEQMRWSDIATRLPDQPPSAVVLDANLSQDCIGETVNAFATHYQAKVPVIALSVSPAKSVRWLNVADKVDVLLCNRREAAALTKLDWQTNINLLADGLLETQFSRFAITDGSNNILVQEHLTRSTVVVPKIQIDRNVNGAGDAMAGATIAGLVSGQTLTQAIGSTGLQAARAVLLGDSEPPAI